MSSKTCLTCQETLRGRSDKKFCDDACRSMHHQQKAQDELGSLRQINALLKKNRQILARLWQSKKSEGPKLLLQRMSLLQQGFVFDFHTHQSFDSNGRRIQYWYDLGLMEEEDGRLALLLF